MLRTLASTKVEFFYSGRIRTLVAMATYSSHRLIMGKVEIGSFCCLTGDFLFVFSSPPCCIPLLSKWLNLIGWRGDIKGKFSKKIFKILLLRNCKEDEADNWHTCIGHCPLQKL